LSRASTGGDSSAAGHAQPALRRRCFLTIRFPPQPSPPGYNWICCLFPHYDGGGGGRYAGPLSYINSHPPGRLFAHLHPPTGTQALRGSCRGLSHPCVPLCPPDGCPGPNAGDHSFCAPPPEGRGSVLGFSPENKTRSAQSHRKEQRGRLNISLGSNRMQFSPSQLGPDRPRYSRGRGSRILGRWLGLGVSRELGEVRGPAVWRTTFRE